MRRVGQSWGRWKKVSAALAGVCLSGCSGPQSALMPAGAGAERLADLFWVMLFAAGLIWTAVLSLAIGGTTFGLRLGPRGARRLIVWGGVVFPTVTVLACLIYGLVMISDLRAREGDVKIAISGEQYWWRITYKLDDGRTVETANVLHLPRGRHSELALTSPDVIHSFWVPALAGKLDLIPGYTNRLVLEPQRTGVFRGQCAEFCGRSHSFMALDAVVMEPADFDAWLQAEAANARPPETENERRGFELFFAEGCQGCHSVRGTLAKARIGPDLTHVASRRSIAAGALKTSHENFERWIGNSQAIKPGNRMPSYESLGPAELAALAAYMEGLQ